MARFEGLGKTLNLSLVVNQLTMAINFNDEKTAIYHTTFNVNLW